MPNLAESLVELFAPLPANHERLVIPEGDAGTAATIKQMQKLVSQAKRDFRIRDFAGQIIAACESKDYYCYAKAVYEWCRDKVQYAYDPYNVEYVENPVRVLEMTHPILDCDSNCVLLSSFYESLGFRTAYVTIKADVSRPNEFSHVYLKVQIPKHGWIAADPTMPTKSFGWEAPGNWPRKFWHGSLDSLGEPLDEKELNPMNGLGCGCGGGCGCGCEEKSALGGLGDLSEMGKVSAARQKKMREDYQKKKKHLALRDKQQKEKEKKHVAREDKTKSGTVKCPAGQSLQTPCPGMKPQCFHNTPSDMSPMMPSPEDCERMLAAQKKGVGQFMFDDGVSNFQMDMDPPLAGMSGTSLGFHPFNEDTQLSGLGDDVSANEMLVEAIWKGDTANELESLRTENMDMRGKLANAKDKILAMPAGPERDQKLADWQRADTASINSLNTVHQAVAKYNEVARTIETVMRSTGVSARYYPRQLGIEPMTVAIVAGLAISAAVALNALSNLLYAARGQTNTSKTYLESISDIISGTTSLISTVAIVGGLGLAGYLLFKWQKGRHA